MIYFILLIVSFSLTYFIKNYAIKKSLIAEVNERSSHSTPTPHGGGISIAVTWFIGLFYLYCINEIDETLFIGLLLGIVIAILSFFDDIYELSPKIRLLVQALISLSLILLLGGLNNINFYFFVIENQFITNIISFLMIIWFINLYNFLDGINGYAGSEGAFLALSGFIFFGDNHFLVLLVSVLGFLYWNWNKAKIFMGDVGSTLLGYNIAVFTIFYSNQESTNFWIWIILFSLFWFDATVTLVRRKLNNEKISEAHKKHAYQRLNQSGWSHFKVTNFSILSNLCLFLIVYLIPNIFISISITLIYLIFCMKFVDNKKAFN